LFNQVLIDPVPPGLDPASAELFVQLVIDEIRAEGTCWIGGTRWRGLPMLRVSVANWSTTTADIDRSAAAIRAAVRHVTEFYRTP
jgi:hypothetical protein